MSRYPGYISLDISTDATVFEFTSTGPKGDIKKIIQFVATTAEGVYNLTFGNQMQNGQIDDITINNNKDRDKILATVATTVFNFTERFPECYVFFTGSSAERTRLYRMALTLNYEELIQTFDIWGLVDGAGFENFQKHRTYNGFLIRRK